jgi:transcriptional regulator with XRE-family HTH domain
VKGTQAQKKLGDAIRKRREALGFSQEKFAETVGMHRTYYGNVELGKHNVSLQSLLKISDGLKRRLGDLFTDAGL